MKARTQVFRDPKGNRFIFPSFIIYPGRDEPSASDVILKSMAVGMAIQCTVEKDWLEFDPENFPHFSMEAASPAFFHGAATVLLFEGPDYDVAKEESNAVVS